MQRRLCFLRCMKGTRKPCRNGYFRASARPARAASSPVSSTARARTAGPVGFPFTVDGAISTRGSFRSRLTFQAALYVRT